MSEVVSRYPFLAGLIGFKQTGETQWESRCPAHDDDSPSLGISICHEGKLVLHCHAGCSVNEVTRALGVEVRDLYSTSTAPSADGYRSNGKTPPRIVVTYDYRDEAGELLSQVCRKTDKTFPQRRPDGDGGWDWSTKGVRKVLYRLPELLASKTSETAFICEGEKDADNLRRLGLVSTCSPGGASKDAHKPKWRSEYADPLRHRRCVIVPDADNPGAAHAQATAQSLHGKAASVRIVDLPDLPPKGDVSDWLQAGGTIEELQRLAVEEPEWRSPSDAVVNDKIRASQLDAYPTARRFIAATAMQDGRLTLRSWNGGFHVYDGTRWASVVDEEEIKARVMRFLDPRYERLTRGAVENVVACVKAESMTPSTVEQPSWLICPIPFPADEALVATNGIVSLPSIVDGKPNVLAPTPDLFTATALDYPIDFQAPAPKKWFAFLDQLWPSDRESVQCLQTWFGLMLTPSTQYQKALLLVGPKRSGKETVARVLRRLVGPANVCAPTLGSLAANFGLAPLLGKSVAIISNARLSGRTDQSAVVERLLTITGEDALSIDRKYQTAVTTKLPTRFMLLTNELPKLADVSGALSSRFIILTLTESWYGKEDHGLTDRLLPELPSILLWAIRGWELLRDQGRLIQPESGRELVQELDDLSSPIGAFVRDRCVVGAEHTVAVDTLFEHWKQWCEASGKGHHGDKATFGRNLRASVTSIRHRQSRDGFSRSYVYEGIAIDD